MWCCFYARVRSIHSPSSLLWSLVTKCWSWSTITGNKRWQTHTGGAAEPLRCTSLPFLTHICFCSFCSCRVRSGALQISLTAAGEKKPKKPTLSRSELAEHNAMKQYPEVSDFPNCSVWAGAGAASQTGPVLSAPAGTGRYEWCMALPFPQGNPAICGDLATEQTLNARATRRKKPVNLQMFWRVIVSESRREKLFVMRCMSGSKQARTKVHAPTSVSAVEGVHL